MSTTNRNTALKSLKWMLKRMQANFSTKEFTWDFMDARDNFLGEVVSSPQSSVTLQSPTYLSVDNDIEITQDQDIQNLDNSNKENFQEMFKQLFQGFNNFTTGLSEQVKIMTDQNKALLDQRSEHTSRLEEFERNKRTRSRAYSSSEHSSVDSRYFKRNRVYSDHASYQDEAGCNQSLEIPKTVLN